MYEKLQLLKIRIVHHADTEKTLEHEMDQIHQNITHLYTALTLADNTLTQTHTILASIINQCSGSQNKQAIDTLTCKLHDVNRATVNCLPKISTNVSYISQTIERKRQQISINAKKINTLNMLTACLQHQAIMLALRDENTSSENDKNPFLVIANHVETLVNGMEEITKLSKNNASKMEKIATEVEQLSKMAQILTAKLC